MDALLRLRDADESFGRITLEVGSEADYEDIWTRSGEWFEDFDPLTYANWSVTQASLSRYIENAKRVGPK